MNCNASSHEHANKQMNNNKRWSVREGKLLKYERSRRIVFRDKCSATLQGKGSFFFFSSSLSVTKVVRFCVSSTPSSLLFRSNTRGCTSLSLTFMGTLGRCLLLPSLAFPNQPPLSSKKKKTHTHIYVKTSVYFFLVFVTVGVLYSSFFSLSLPLRFHVFFVVVVVIVRL